MLNAQIVRLKRQGKDNVTHKPAIESEDLMKLPRQPLHRVIHSPSSAMCGFTLFYSFAGGEGKVRGSWRKRASSLKLTRQEEDLSQRCKIKRQNTIPEECVMYPAARNWQECTKHLKRTTDTKLWSFTWPNSILSAMLSFSIQERILIGSMAMKFGSTSDQLVPTNSTGWWKASVRKRNSPKWTPTTASEPPQSPYGRMLVYRTATL